MKLLCVTNASQRCYCPKWPLMFTHIAIAWGPLLNTYTSFTFHVPYTWNQTLHVGLAPRVWFWDYMIKFGKVSVNTRPTGSPPQCFTTFLYKSSCMLGSLVLSNIKYTYMHQVQCFILLLFSPLLHVPSHQCCLWQWRYLAVDDMTPGPALPSRLPPPQLRTESQALWFSGKKDDTSGLTSE